ncbi:MAG: MOSC domain-containing protein [Saprospiraceae bacterium]|nr:MOSC domain-containing protein [Saprospiraceae bacterium]
MTNLFTISNLYIYPVKSFAGVELSEADALKSGFRHDRRWMVIDENNRFITQRTHPLMSHIQVDILNDNITLDFKSDQVIFNIEEEENNQLEVIVWEDKAMAIEVSGVISKWVSDILGGHYRLVRMLDEDARLHRSSTGEIFNVSFADGYPYHIIGDQSLHLLNNKLENELEMKRFRPNIVCTTSVAHEEDNWKIILAGNAVFRHIKPCGRCVMINLNNEDLSYSKEPLKTLNNYRKEGNSVNFGINLVCEKEGIVRAGDRIIVE